MQSAARVPILVSFEVEEYQGPDNDPILKSGTSLDLPNLDNPDVIEQSPLKFQSKESKSLTLRKKKDKTSNIEMKMEHLMKNESIVINDKLAVSKL